MVETMPLSSLAVGEKCRIKGLSHCGTMRSRLCELGFVAGARAECLVRGFSGDPGAYRICGAVIALRQCDAGKICVVPEGK